MTAPETAPGQFSVRAALGLWLVVLRRRPAAFFGVALVTLVLQAVLSGLLTYAYAEMGAAFAQASLGVAEFNAQAMRASLLTVLYPLLSFPLWFWFETAWLRLYNNEARPWAMRWSEPGFLVLSYLVVFGIYFGGLIVSIIFTLGVALTAYSLMSTISWMAGAFWVYLIAVPLILLPYFAIGAVLAKFSALPALSVMRRTLDPGAAWRATKGALWRIIAAWIIALVIYGGLLVAFVQIAKSWSPVLRAYWDMMAMSFHPVQDPDNLIHPYTAFAGLFDTPGAAFWLAADALAIGVLYLLGSAIMRGIGVTLAWRAPARPDRPSTAQGSDA